MALDNSSKVASASSVPPPAYIPVASNNNTDAASASSVSSPAFSPVGSNNHTDAAPASSVPPVSSPAIPNTAQARPASTLIIGESLVRHVSVQGAVTHFYPGALVSDINLMLPGILDRAPSAKMW